MSWPMAPRGGKQLIGRGSNPAQTGLLPLAERIGEAARAPRRVSTAAPAGQIHVFHAWGSLTVDRVLSDPSTVLKSGRLVEVTARTSPGQPSDTAIVIALYRIPSGSLTPTLIDTFTLNSGAEFDRWGLDTRVRNGDSLATALTLGGVPSSPAGGMVISAKTQ